MTKSVFREGKVAEAMLGLCHLSLCKVILSGCWEQLQSIHKAGFGDVQGLWQCDPPGEDV